ncbi:efflux RND transporter permease subunit, partial [Acinetobacter baumannii]
GVFQSLGQPTVRIDIDRVKAARYGLSPDDINQTVAAAIGGTAPGFLYEPHTDRHFPIVVRMKQDQRDSLEAVKRITVGATAPDGSAIQV